MEAIPLIPALILAVVQGATEFLPVSSSAHLVLAGKLTGLPELPLGFVVVVHLGTLLSVLFYYRADLASFVRGLACREATVGPEASGPANARRVLLFILLGTIPAGVLGLLFHDFVDSLFSQALPAGIALFVTATLLCLADRYQGTKTPDQIGWKDALLVGLGQALAIMPGISRSGATVWAALSRGLSPAWAPRFSFLLSIPAIAGAGLVEAKGILEEPLASGQLTVYLIAGLLAAGVGYVSIHLVVDSVRRGSLFRRFGVYCLAVGTLTIIASLTGYLS
jgi:undecaprenyl-diphosphatase